jgi:hypothetical protein
MGHGGGACACACACVRVRVCVCVCSGMYFVQCSAQRGAAPLVFMYVCTSAADIDIDADTNADAGTDTAACCGIAGSQCYATQILIYIHARLHTRNSDIHTCNTHHVTPWRVCSNASVPSFSSRLFSSLLSLRELRRFGQCEGT